MRRRMGAAALVGAVIAVAGWSASVWGQGAAASAAGGGGVPTVYELFMTSKYINGALLAMSVIGLGWFLILLFQLDARSFTPPRFVDEVTRLIFGRQYDQALVMCRNHPRTFVAGIVQRVIENRDQDPGVLMEIVASEGRRKGEGVWARAGYLAEISNIAPMLGLLGTVVGMIKVFFTLTTNTGGQKAAELSSGIAEAMGTTMFGLIVAIGAWLFHAIIRSRATGALTEAERVCHGIADATHRNAGGARPALKGEAGDEAERVRRRKRLRRRMRERGEGREPRPDTGGPLPDLDV